MSQYPPQSSPPLFDYSRPYRVDPASELLRPARQASVLMWVFGGLCICLAVCAAGLSRFITPELLASNPQAAELQEQIRRAQEQFHVSFRTLMLTAAIQILIPGVAMTGLAFWVRRGGRPAAVVSAALTGLFLAILVMNLLFGAAGAQLLPTLCAFCVPLVLLGATLKSLIEAARNAPGIVIARGSTPGPASQSSPYAGGWTASAPPLGLQAPTHPPRQGLAAFPPYAPPSPPTGQPPIQYGYAQAPAPVIQQPPPGDAPVVAQPGPSVPSGYEPKRDDSIDSLRGK